ncbi:HTH_48 domain-containing protein [Nephila pilipes]|uniref:HTH_48 domain-containing protein n=1 Tax=Nephila pilipes TaxID=299642 RepID=A0A8X6QN65_NEPPI|nr:HTH_48 domain-containing protein [Nephila pilipes]
MKIKLKPFWTSVIKYWFTKGNIPMQLKEELDSTYGDSAPSFTDIKFWAAEFKRGRTSLADDEGSKRQETGSAENCVT